MVKNIWILNHHVSTVGHRHYEIAKKLSSKGYRVTVIGSGHKFGVGGYMYDKECTIENVCTGFNYAWLNTKPDFIGGNVKRVFNMIDYALLVKKHADYISGECGRPDVVIGSSVHPLAWEGARIISRKYKIKLILELRDEWPLTLIEIGGINRHHPIIYFFDFINKRALKKADGFIGTSKGMYEYVKERYGIIIENNIWVPNGCNIEKDKEDKEAGTELPEKLKEILNNWCVTYAGSITKAEGLDYFMEVIKKFNSKYSLPVSFLIVGDGNYRDMITDTAERCGMNNVFIYGPVPKTMIHNILKDSKICVAPARFKGKVARYGLSMNKLNDYLYAEKPTILTHEGYNVVSDSGCGYCVPYDDVEAFADCIAKLYEMPESQRRQMGAKGKEEICNNYNFDIISGAYEKVISRAYE